MSTPSLKWLWCQEAKEGSTRIPRAVCRRRMGYNPNRGRCPGPNPDPGGMQRGRNKESLSGGAEKTLLYTPATSRDKAQGPRMKAGGRWTHLQPDPGDVSTSQPLSHCGANKARGAAQTLHAAGKQGPSVPFNALFSLILYLCSPSEERTHSGSFITALITAAGIKAPGCRGAGLCSCRKPIPF